MRIILNIKFLTLFMMLLLLAPLQAKPLKKLMYNQKQSVSYNEKQFLQNLKIDCQNYGYDRKVKEDSPADVLATYPKELSMLYLNKHYKNICYYGASTLLKYLHSDFKSQTQKVLIQIVHDCIKKNSKDKVCEGITSKASLFDLTSLLGAYCNRDTLRAFKTINCEYKKVVDNECKLYKNSSDPLNDCPYGFSNRSEVNELYKSYYGPKCKTRNLRWHKPKCLK